MGRYLVIGGSGGIGAALTRLLAGSGHTVDFTGRNAQAIAEVAASTGATGHFADTSLPDYMSTIASICADRIDGLAYCPGTINLKPLARLSEADFMADFQVNALSAVQSVQAALPALKQAEGMASIVLFSSVAVGQGFANHASISMAKGAVEGLTRALAAEFAPKVRVNCIAPSLSETGLAKPITSNAAMANAVAALHAIPRLGLAEDSAAMAAFLLAGSSSWITGQVFAVDGGRSRTRTKG